MKLAAALVLAASLVLSACSPSDGPEVGGQTNWLKVCDSSDECGGLECLCGACTAACDDDAACTDLPGASCRAESHDSAVAFCSGRVPPGGLCLPSCEASCPEDTTCVAGTCVPIRLPTVAVDVDSAVRHQPLVGFGASLAYGEDAIVANRNKAALYDLVFGEAGLDVIRMGNRHEGGDSDELASATEIIEEASDRLGRRPMLFMTSGSPPAALKASGKRLCTGDAKTCTLASVPGGGFDYAGFARYWRSSLEAYANAGILPDYVSIQNNPNWLPPADNANDACHFLPEEGTQTVTSEGAPLELAYPGYREALAAVRAAMADLRVKPKLAAPEANALAAVDDYVTKLDASTFDAVAIHLYYLDAATVDASTFAPVLELADRLERPVFQTEMQAEGLDTAILVHHAFNWAGASAYLQNDLVSLKAANASIALVLLNADDLEPQGPYYALSHYAKSTDPGWFRVDATSASSGILSSAWVSPDDDAITVVLVNPRADDRDVELELAGDERARMKRTRVTRTVFDGIERAADLGELPASGVVRVPGHAIVTVALEQR